MRSRSAEAKNGIRGTSSLSVAAGKGSPSLPPAPRPLVVGAAQTTAPSSATSKSEKLGCRTKASTPGITTPKSKRNSIGKMRLLIARIRPGATTTLRRAWGMIKRDGRRLEHSNSSPLHPFLCLRKGKSVHAEQVVADMVDEVLARQAAVRARWSGESLGDALGAVVRIGQ
jgi:hypothetical protein